MAQYNIVIRKTVHKDMQSIPKKDAKRIIAAIESLAENPRPQGSKKLSAQERYRLRQGNYRILYEIEDMKLIVCVVTVRHRKDVYR